MEILLVLLAAVLIVVAARDRTELRRRIEALERAVTELKSRRLQPRDEADTPTHLARAATPPAPEAGPPRPAAGPPPVAQPAAAPAFAASAAARTEPSAPAAPRPFPTPPRHRVPPPPDPALPGWLQEFFSGGNLIVRLGVVVLFFGVAFLLRYAAEHSHLSIESRLAGVAAGGLVLLALGWRLRERRRGYALALQGAGVGVMYLTVFAAFRLFSVLPSAGAFALLAAIAALSALLAVLADSLAFAMLGTAGGFLAPVLASTGTGSHVVLFSYFAMLDLAVVAIAWFRSWRALNLLAFAFTFGIGTAWGVLKYTPGNFATTEPFLVLFFLMFVAIAVLFAIQRAPQVRHEIDSTLIFGTPVVSFGLQAGMVRDVHYALAYSALALAAFYLLLARLLYARRESHGLLVESFLALGIAFLTLAVPFALEGRWTAATWALEGAAAVWIGLRQQRSLPVAAGLLLQLLAALAYFWEGVEWLPASPDPLLLNSRYLGAMLVGAGGLVIAARLRHAGDAERMEVWARWSSPVLGWALLWWLAAGFWEVERHVAPARHLASGVLYSTATAVLASALGARLAWPALRAAALLIVPGLCLFALAGWDLAHPFADGGWWAWPPAFVFAALVLLRDETVVGDGGRTALHTLALWLLALVATLELAYQTGLGVHGARAWPEAVRGAVPSLLLLVAALGSERERWPFQAAPRAYAGYGALGLAAYAIAWCLYTCAYSNGAAAPLPYVPLLNPLDLAEGFALLALVAALRAAPRTGLDRRHGVLRFAAFATGFAAFLWLNALALRTLAHYWGVSYTLEAVMASTLAQTTLTIFWSVLALVGMGVASRSGRRFVWIAGAVLLGLVTIKLFLVDLSRTGTVPRIVSFLGVGLLMLVIGYLSPLPPESKESTDEP